MHILKIMCFLSKISSLFYPLPRPSPTTALQAELTNCVLRCVVRQTLSAWSIRLKKKCLCKELKKDCSNLDSSNHCTYREFPGESADLRLRPTAKYQPKANLSIMQSESSPHRPNYMLNLKQGNCDSYSLWFHPTANRTRVEPLEQQAFAVHFIAE